MYPALLQDTESLTKLYGINEKSYSDFNKNV